MCPNTWIRLTLETRNWQTATVEAPLIQYLYSQMWTPRYSVKWTVFSVPLVPGLPTRSNPIMSITVIMSNTFWICTRMSKVSIIITYWKMRVQSLPSQQKVASSGHCSASLLSWWGNSHQSRSLSSALISILILGRGGSLKHRLQ